MPSTTLSITLAIASTMAALILTLVATYLVKSGAWILVWPHQQVKLTIYNLAQSTTRVKEGEIIYSLPYRLIIRSEGRRFLINPKEVIDVSPLEGEEEIAIQDILLGSMENLIRRPKPAHLSK
jgi:hypothetical protein